jgi:hypothetical protein
VNRWPCGTVETWKRIYKVEGVEEVVGVSIGAVSGQKSYEEGGERM